MNANAVPLLAIFEKKVRLEVPLFQRQYVWNQEHQWEPLWEDISRKFTEYLEGRKDAPVHFLGAMVLDLKQTPITHVEKRQIIDGQQRLITLQIFLAAFRDFCAEQSCEDLAKECESFTVNKGMMANAAIDKFKVWPTQLDRDQFVDVISSGSKAALEKKHPLITKKYRRKPEPRPRMVEAYLFFYSELRDFFLPAAADAQSEIPLSMRVEECFQALKSAIQVVAIDLDQGDDAQVIFETLNARGEPLLPADLLRNYIFLRAARKGESQEALYEEYWRSFDGEFWRTEIKQGRLLRPRSDLFMQHFLSSQQTIDIPIKHLFVEYKYWIEKAKPFETVREELATLAKYGAFFHRLSQAEKGDFVSPLVEFLEAFDVGTTYPLLLAILNAGIGESQWPEFAGAIESYILRRAVCNLGTKNYNRIFLSATKHLRKEGFTPKNLQAFLKDQTGESSLWPSDELFSEKWRTQLAYFALSNPKLVYIFKQISDTYITGKSEALEVGATLTIEHILPQTWQQNWPLQDGSKGLTLNELLAAPDDDPVVRATRERDAILQTFGNLTILTLPLNASVSNAAWKDKKPELLLHSLLPINQVLHKEEAWDENAIQRRSIELLTKALNRWPGPPKAEAASGK